MADLQNVTEMKNQTSRAKARRSNVTPEECPSGAIHPNPGSKRAQKQKETREKLLHAAAQQVGMHGYAGASIHKITTAANIANGTFYNYFASQQDLFNQLLPELGNELLDAIRKDIQKETNGLKREEIGFRTFFSYVANNPYFYRILNEAEVFAPEAYSNHMLNMAKGYVRALKNAAEKEELNEFSEREMEVIVYILLSARNYISYRFAFQNGKIGRLPDWITEVYMKFVTRGLARTEEYIGAVEQPTSRIFNPSPEYHVKHGANGYVEVSLHIMDDQLDSKGYIKRSVIFGLIDCAATAVSLTNNNDEAQLISLNNSFSRDSHARNLLATAKVESNAGRVLLGSVTISESDGHLSPIATAQFVFASENIKELRTSQRV